MYDVPGSGKHHRRPDGGGRHAKYHRPSVSWSDKIWISGAIGYLVLMTQGGIAERIVLTVLAAGAVVWRLVHHSGDRYRNGLQTSPQEQEEFQRITGEIPVIEPTAVTSLSQVSPVTVAVQPQGRPSWLPQLLAVGGAVLMASLAEASERRVEQARRIERDTDSLLGIPGKWNNYQPTLPSMGTRGWGAKAPPLSYESSSGTDMAKRAQASLMGYDRDRFSGANQEKWEQFFR